MTISDKKRLIDLLEVRNFNNVTFLNVLEEV